MTRSDCDICGGSGSIRLPVRAKMSARYSDYNSSIEPTQSSRTYACPECGPSIDQERIALLYTKQDVSAHPSYMNDDRYHEAMLRDAAHCFVDMLLRDGYIKQERGSVDTDKMVYEIRSTLGVVSPSVVASMEARIAERQGEVAVEVANEAMRLINHWGSHYGTTTLSKVEACRFVQEAVRSIANPNRH